jgi:hypothetical protein
MQHRPATRRGRARVHHRRLAVLAQRDAAGPRDGAGRTLGRTIDDVRQLMTHSDAKTTAIYLEHGRGAAPGSA